MTGAAALTAELAARMAGEVLANVRREFPNKLDHVLAQAADALPPRALHPIFYGSFDWHSCVHGYWLLGRLLRRFPQLPQAAAILDLMNEQLTPANVAAELAYLQRAHSGTFERPYGWAWLLKVAAELATHPAADAPRWARTLAPLAQEFARRLAAYAQALVYPVRAGTHGSTAFACILAAGYADACGDAALRARLAERTAAWFAADAEAQAWEPSGEDFLSPVLTEAHCRLQLMPAAEFDAWFARFLPRLGAGEPAALLTPAVVGDRRDPRLVHLDGLNLSRAWSLRALAGAMPAADPRRPLLLAAAARHVEASLPHIFADYAGGHWLASFAVLALEA